MHEGNPTLEDVLELVAKLSPEDRELLAERMSELDDRNSIIEQRRRRRSLLGIASDLGPAPSAEEIDDARREAWKNFPREDMDI